MKRFIKSIKSFALIVVLLSLAILAGVALAQKERGDIRIIVVSHGQASDPFWSVVKNGVDQAASDMRVTVEYQAPQTFDMVAMSQLIDAAVAAQCPARWPRRFHS
jgi:simple sugar transport system substrate-binding protein